MYLFLKIIICVTFIFLWLRACRKDIVQSLGHYFFILFITILIYDVFALNHEWITINENKYSLIHLIMDRIILVPFSLFFLQRINRHLYIKFSLSLLWICLFSSFETINEMFHIVVIRNMTFLKWGYMGGTVAILSLIFAYWLKELGRSRFNNAPSK
ncbi:MAG TPA: hypothetical protein VEV44_14445 [Pseudoneobacillus sp.]|nr:hypothetical protein [Pseudoneobacillus sp.]